MTEWICVEDRIPSHKNVVVVLTNDNALDFGWLSSGTFRRYCNGEKIKYVVAWIEVPLFNGNVISVVEKA